MNDLLPARHLDPATADLDELIDVAEEALAAGQSITRHGLVFMPDVIVVENYANGVRLAGTASLNFTDEEHEGRQVLLYLAPDVER